MKLNLTQAQRLDALLVNIRDARHFKTDVSYQEPSPERDDFELLETYGLVVLQKGGGIIALATITDAGRDLLLSGGLVGKYEETLQLNKDRELDRQSKITAIRTSKWSLAVSILALLVAITALLKDVIAKLLFSH